MRVDDEALVERAKKGDVRSYEELVMRYSRLVFAAAYGVLEDVEAARDVSQETFLRAWLKIRDFRGRSKFSTWVYSVARNAALDHIRKMKVRATVPVEDVPEPSYEPDHRAEIIDSAMECLDERERECLNLHFRGGLSAAEIADVMGLSEGNIRVIMFRARKKLRERLQGRENELLGG